MKQGSAEWLQSRVGRITASRVIDVLNFRKDGKPGADRLRYFSEILCERLTGIPSDHYVTPAMAYGSDNEAFARAAYEVGTGNEVEEVGSVIHPTMPFFSASPDGLIAPDGIVEFKVPTTITHLAWLDEGVVPPEHKAQMLSGMVCCGRAFCDFTSYDSRLPLPLQRFTRRLEFDQEEVARIEAAVRQFDAEVNDTIDRLQKTYGEFTLPSQITAKSRRSQLSEQLEASLYINEVEIRAEVERMF